MLSGNCKKCGKQSLRLSDGLCFRCKFIQNKEDHIRKMAGIGLAEPVKDIPPDPPMETAEIVEPWKLAEPPKKKKRAPRKKKKE